MAYVASHEGFQDREQLTRNSIASAMVSPKRTHSRARGGDSDTNHLGAFINESNWGVNAYTNHTLSINSSQYNDIAKWVCDQPSPSLDSSFVNKTNIDLHDLHNYSQWIHELYCTNVWPGDDNNNIVTQFGITSAQNIASPKSALEVTHMEAQNSNPNFQGTIQQKEIPNSSIRPNSASYTALQSLIANGFSKDGGYDILSQELGQNLAGAGNNNGDQAPETSSGSTTEAAESVVSPGDAAYLVGSDSKKRRRARVCGDGRKRTRHATAASCSPPASAGEDVVHVRAKRGHATDSHSLAERIRRERISQRMKLLQELVPSCNKVLGKAAMLEEIINYVKSLQRQIEFLSMKLAASNPSNILIKHSKPFSSDEEEYVVLSGSSFWRDGHAL